MWKRKKRSPPEEIQREGRDIRRNEFGRRSVIMVENPGLVRGTSTSLGSMEPEETWDDGVGKAWKSPPMFDIK